MKKMIAALVFLVAAGTQAADVSIIPFQDLNAAVFADFKSGDLMGSGYLHAVSYNEVAYIDVGVVGDSENGLGSPFVGLSFNLATVAVKNRLAYKLPRELILGPTLSYDFREKTSRAGLTIAWEFAGSPVEGE